jgi:hypothetical protein
LRFFSSFLLSYLRRHLIPCSTPAHITPPAGTAEDGLFTLVLVNQDRHIVPLGSHHSRWRAPRHVQHGRQRDLPKEWSQGQLSSVLSRRSWRTGGDDICSRVRQRGSAGEGGMRGRGGKSRWSWVPPTYWIHRNEDWLPNERLASFYRLECIIDVTSKEETKSSFLSFSLQ